MTTCYFIQTHKHPEQIYRLVRTIKRSSPTAKILIGHDFINCQLDFSPLRDLPNIDLLKINFSVRRGRFSLLQPYLNAIEWLHQHNQEFDWLVYLSGQDYPTQSLHQMEQFLSDSGYDGFMRYWDINSPESPWGAEKGHRRYCYHYYELPDKLARWFFVRRSKIERLSPIRFYPTYGSLIGLPARSVPFNEKFVCYGGRQWHSLSRKCINFLRNFFIQDRSLINYYQRTVVPDESLIQTILVNSGLFHLCNDDRRYVDFSGDQAGHPRTLTVQDYETLKSEKFSFARKFDLNEDVEILDLLDAKIFG
ncbi:MAG: beta-1,6-N-acetylglucosaminyltransferase [Trichocoleus desertorum ATA4-8-CV12]|jgi:hypothetical protein|nr:beta-1,6-N-acetylglucosaminyltransferase [Trichocoleus desertorum ATA4-8-CV12]